MLVDINAFIGRISGGEKPVVIGRGHHDTRGKLAELLPEHIATDGDKTYFNFTLGPIDGVVKDCGEDKMDGNIEYGGVNGFEQYRTAEARDLYPSSVRWHTAGYLWYPAREKVISCIPQ